MKKRQKDKKIIYIILITIIIIVAIIIIKKILTPPVLPSPHDVIRTFSRTDLYLNEELTVDLGVVFDPGDRVYSIEETLPSQATVIDAGNGILRGRRIRWLEYTDDPINNPLTNRIKTYRVSFSAAGTYIFSGTYIFNKEKKADILGDFQVVVTECIPNPLGEICDGIDNDCDRLVDEQPDLLCTAPGNIEPDDAMSCVAGTCVCLSTYSEDTSCNGCVSTNEISNYIYNWLNEIEVITQEEATYAAYDWLTGVTACA